MSNERSGIVSLWGCGLGVGGIFLSFEVEFLAILTWCVSSVVAAMLLYLVALFGESKKSSSLKRWIPGVGVLVVSALILLLGSKNLDSGLVEIRSSDLYLLGTELIQGQFIALEVLLLTLFLTIVGTGVIMRPDKVMQVRKE